MRKKVFLQKLTLLAAVGSLLAGNCLPVLAEGEGQRQEEPSEEQEKAESAAASVIYQALDRSSWKVSASSERPGTHEAAFAIDGNPATMWHAAGPDDESYGLPYEFNIDLGAPDQQVSRIELTGRNDGQGLQGFPKTMEIQSSSDGVTYSKVQDVTFETSPYSGITEAVDLESPVNDQYIRLVIKENWYTEDNDAVSFAEINLYQAVEDIPQDVTVITSPDGELETTFWLNAEGRPMYQISRNGEQIVEESSLGFVLDEANGGAMQTDFTLLSKETDSADETWEPAVALTASSIRDHYNQTVFHLADDQNRKVDIIFRNYDEGVAFRYYFPEEDNALDSFEIVSEQSQFAIPEGTIAHAYGSGNQQIPGNTPVEELGSSARYSPIVLEYHSGTTAAAIYESDLYDYGRLKLQQIGNGVLQTNVQWGSNIQASAPFETPWRAVCVADQIGELQTNQTLMMNLADECAIEDTSWIKPGGLIREAKLTDENTIDCIDFAAEHNIPYIMYDSGWYGTENDESYSPMVPYKGEFPYMKGGSTMRTCDVDIRDHLDYAEEKGVGVILYVNRVHLESYDLDEVFSTYQQWGIKGVKFGFVQSGSQKWSKWLEDAIATAAKYHLLVIVHDEVIPSGLERTYPNLVNMEGVLGDEGKPGAADDLKQIFTRSVLGPADHCYCMPVSKYISAQKTDAFNMALSMLYYAPTPSLYWYGTPAEIEEEERPELKFWDDMPTTWDESLCIDSSYGEYFTMARRNGDEWYLGSASAVDRTFTFQPSYLEDGVKYLAEIYSNSADDTIQDNKIQVKKYIIDSTDSIDFYIMAAGGVSIRMAPATEEDMASVPTYDPVRFELESLTERVAALNLEDYTDASVRNSGIRETLEAAQELLAQADAGTEQMQEMVDALKSAQEMLVTKNRLLDPVDLSEAVITTDNEREDLRIEYAIDGDVNTKWHTLADTNPPFELTLDLGSQQRIRRVEILGRNDHVNGYPLAFEVLVSDDGENFEKVMDVNWSGVSVYYGCCYGFDLPEDVNTRYLRLHFTDSYISSSPYKPVSIAGTVSVCHSFRRTGRSDQPGRRGSGADG